MQKRHRIRFPKNIAHNTGQDAAYFYLQGKEKDRTIRFHDYDEIYQIQGLYEQIYYDRLKCTSPSKVTSILKSAVHQSEEYFTEHEVL